MRIAVGSDHRGYLLKEKVAALLTSAGHEVINAGTMGPDSVDYPDYATIVAKQVSEGITERGILVCGTGIGMAITANKFPGVRAASCTDEVSAEISRRHNNLNVLCLAGDMLSIRQAERIVNIWLSTEFEGGRHERRIEKIHQIEKDFSSPR
ncbi:MAG: ribose 5-phosphate isomerase B [Pirellulales bacterium]|nr:ribose 5-phosphate isomerase B [Pirellulales bacterium]